MYSKIWENKQLIWKTSGIVAMCKVKMLLIEQKIRDSGDKNHKTKLGDFFYENVHKLCVLKFM